MAVKGKEGADPKNNDWPLTIKKKKKKEFGWIMSLDFLTIYWQYHSLFSDLENILQPFLSMEISDRWINGSYFQAWGFMPGLLLKKLI